MRHETLAKLSGLPEAMIDSIEAALKGHRLVPPPRGDDLAVAAAWACRAVHAMAVARAAALLGRPAERDLALALIISRSSPGLQAVHSDLVDDTTLGADLGAATVSAGRIYEAMDWLE